MVFGIFYYLINGIAWYCIVLYCVVGFGARAVSRKTPIYFIIFLSSPRAKRARAVTVSQCPHSEVGQDFLLRRRVTLTETAVTRKRKV